MLHPWGWSQWGTPVAPGLRTGRALQELHRFTVGALPDRSCGLRSRAPAHLEHLGLGGLGLDAPPPRMPQPLRGPGSLLQWSRQARAESPDLQVSPGPPRTLVVCDQRTLESSPRSPPPRLPRGPRFRRLLSRREPPARSLPPQQGSQLLQAESPQDPSRGVRPSGRRLRAALEEEDLCWPAH